MVPPRLRIVLVASLVALAVGSSAASAASLPDLMVTRAKGPETAKAGGGVPLDLRVQNRGGKRSAVSRLAVYWNLAGQPARRKILFNVQIEPLRARTWIGIAAGPYLPGDLSGGETIELTACADARRRVRESNEKNNCRRIGLVAVVASDLVIDVDLDLVLNAPGYTSSVQLKTSATARKTSDTTWTTDPLTWDVVSSAVGSTAASCPISLVRVDQIAAPIVVRKIPAESRYEVSVVPQVNLIVGGCPSAGTSLDLGRSWALTSGTPPSIVELGGLDEVATESGSAQRDLMRHESNLVLAVGPA